MNRRAIQSAIWSLPAVAWPAAMVLLGLAAADGAQWLRPALPAETGPRGAIGVGLVMIGLAAFSAGVTRRLGVRSSITPWAWAIEVLTVAGGLAAVIIGSIR